MRVLGIETSCDETSVAICEDNTILCNEIYTQQEHGVYGGVVPEVASRAHLAKVGPLCQAALAHADISPSSVHGIAVTDSPGLAGALLVGISFALGLARSWHVPVTGINHLEGHIFSAFLAFPKLSFPFLALVVSGGHTSLVRADSFGRYTLLGATIDDAAGEAFDKIGKLLGFQYPAGRAIEQEANRATPPFDLTFPVARVKGACDFSFSGLKTAVRYFLQEKPDEWVLANRPRICRAFQEAIVQSLTKSALRAAQQTGIQKLVLVGGVACNQTIQNGLKKAFPGEVYVPPPRLCTDNAAMIARTGIEYYRHTRVRRPHMEPGGQVFSPPTHADTSQENSS